MKESNPSDDQAERLIRDGVRTRWILLSLAFILPLFLHVFTERQARQFEELTQKGVIGSAIPIRSTKTTVHFRYEVDGVFFKRNMARKDLPVDLGTLFPIVYLPNAPKVSVLGDDRRRGTIKAASIRELGWKLKGIALGLVLLFSLFTEYRIAEYRQLGAAAIKNPAAFRRRLLVFSALFMPFLVLLGGYLVEDSIAKGQSVAPVILGQALVLAILSVVFWVLGRGSPQQAKDKSLRIVKAVAPIGLVLATIRLLSWLFTSE